MTSIISFEMDFTAELKIEREIWENRKTYLDIQKLKFLKFFKFILFKNFFISLYEYYVNQASVLNFSITLFKGEFL